MDATQTAPKALSMEVLNCLLFDAQDTSRQIVTLAEQAISGANSDLIAAENLMHAVKHLARRIGWTMAILLATPDGLADEVRNGADWIFADWLACQLKGGAL